MNIVDKLTTLFFEVYNDKPEQIDKLAVSGSARIYYKMKKFNIVVLGAYNKNINENEAFFSFSHTLLAEGIPVPKIIAIHRNKDSYLIEYISDITLYDFLIKNRTGISLSLETINYYKLALRWLPKIQIEAGEKIDFSKCYPCEKFDRQAMIWDLNYFKYYFAKLADIEFDEEKLENDFETIVSFLQKAPSHYFMYRDFQSRNIMLQGENIFFIDYQGGRRGALQYDLASLLWSAKTDLSFELRQEFLEIYLSELSKIIIVDNQLFIKYYYGFVLMRILQTLGAYGFRGLYEHKSYFLQSIPLALRNLKWLLDHNLLPFKLPELAKVLLNIINSKKFDNTIVLDSGVLTVTIHSFSYKKGIPYDNTGNGGGHVFDCRILPNPGKEITFQRLTGCDKAVQVYLENSPDANAFFSSIKDIVCQSIDNYRKRHFTNLMICFGCTGGQHRSVYFAERTAAFLRKNFHDIKVIIYHNEQKQLNKTL